VLLEPQVVHTAASAEASSHNGSGESQRAQGTGIGDQTCGGEYGATAALSTLITRVSTIMSCMARFSASKPAMIYPMQRVMELSHLAK